MKILIAEDNHLYRVALQATLAEWGYEVIAVEDGLAAYEVLASGRCAENRHSRLDDAGLGRRASLRQGPRLRQPEPPYLIVLTSRDGKEDIVAALESGADDHIAKPFDRAELKARLRVGLRIVGLQTSQTVVFAIARAVEAKSPYTQGHAHRVSRYALALAEAIGLSEDEKEVLERGAILHDIGKIAVPDAILNKPGPLTPAEFEIAKQHPEEGVKIVMPLESVRGVIPLIRWHHERPNGTGYPDGLAAAQIPLLVRVLSVADVYDALASEAPISRHLASRHVPASFAQRCRPGRPRCRARQRLLRAPTLAGNYAFSARSSAAAPRACRRGLRNAHLMIGIS